MYRPKQQASSMRYRSEATFFAAGLGNPWWLASEVCSILGIKKNSRDALKSLDDDEKKILSLLTTVIGAIRTG